MKDEVAAAVVFLTRLVKRNKKLSKEQYDKFSDKLTALMVEKFKNHWHTERPHKGQAYRCIRINEFEPVDPILSQAASQSGLVFSDLKLPCELTLWIDPTEVCCRFGETKSTFCTVASFKEEQVDNQALTLDLEEMIEDYNKKRQEEMDKLREFTGKRSPVNIPSMNGGGNYYKGLQPFQGNINFPPQGHHPHHPHHHHNSNHHHHQNGGGRWKPHHGYNGMNGRSKVFNGLHIFHQGDFYGLQQHSSSDEESSGYQGATLYQQQQGESGYVDSTNNNGNNNKVAISNHNNNQQQHPVTSQSIHHPVSSAAVSTNNPTTTPVNMKTGHSSHISQPSAASATSTTAPSGKQDRYRWVKGTEPIKA